jgi:omega-amidase
VTALRVSLLQQPLVWQDPAANRTTGFSMQVETLGEPAGGPTSAWLTHLAARLDAVIAGSVITEDGGRYYNRLVWAQPCGALRHYDKRHLFRMGHEHEAFTPGREAWSLLWRGLRVCPNQAYVVGVNRVGADGHGVAHSGDSAAIDFLGRTLAQASDAAAILNVELDPAALETCRQKFPAHLDADRFTLEP